MSKDKKAVETVDVNELVKLVKEQRAVIEKLQAKRTANSNGGSVKLYSFSLAEDAPVYTKGQKRLIQLSIKALQGKNRSAYVKGADVVEMMKKISFRQLGKAWDDAFVQSPEKVLAFYRSGDGPEMAGLLSQLKSSK